jgi:hypothetical protein
MKTDNGLWELKQSLPPYYWNKFLEINGMGAKKKTLSDYMPEIIGFVGAVAVLAIIFCL